MAKAHVDFGKTDWKGERNTETIADVLRYWMAWPQAGAEWAAWAAPLAGRRDGSSVTCKQSNINLLATL